MSDVLTIPMIRSWKPCYDPTRYVPEDWSGTALDVLEHPEIPIDDKFWVVLRKGVIDDRTLRLFSVACARKALALPGIIVDSRSVVACDVSERFANGGADVKELKAAQRNASKVASCAYTDGGEDNSSSAYASYAAYAAACAYADVASSAAANAAYSIYSVYAVYTDAYIANIDAYIAYASDAYYATANANANAARQESYYEQVKMLVTMLKEVQSV